MGRTWRISGYEWELLESNHHVAGRDVHTWYEIFLASNDVDYLERLLRFWTPPKDDTRFIAEYSRSDFQAGAVRLPTDTRLLRAMAEDPARLFALSWRQFEEFVAELLVELGYEHVTLGRGSGDEGVDLSACLSHPLGIERIIVQCKRFDAARAVGSPSVVQLLGTVETKAASRGLIVTTSRLTRPAAMIVKAYDHRLSSIGGDELRALLTSGWNG